MATKTRPGGWTDWARASGQSRELRPQRFYDHFYLLIQAAACGLGVAMVPKILVLDDLRSGKIVAPLGFVAGPFKIVLWIAPHLRARSETRALVDWLTKEFRKPGMQSDADEPLPMNSLPTAPRIGGLASPRSAQTHGRPLRS